MKNRYQTLDVSLNLQQFNKINSHKINQFSNTIDFQSSSLQNINNNNINNNDKINNISNNNNSVLQNQDRINKFRDLYYKNQKLRKQLKLLNVKLNEKLQKTKFISSKRKKAQSVDLNITKPSKALQKQLQNAYKQVAMYKKQISSLKTKQQSQATYEKYKNLQNQISYKDIEIVQIEAELKSIKNVKKIQDKTLVQDVQNQDLQQRLKAYERQFKQGQQKLKEIAKKARKRQQEYKKQQAYQVALQKKLRNKANNNNIQKQQQQIVQLSINNNKQNLSREVNQQQFYEVKRQINNLKNQNQALQKKLDMNKKLLRDFKKKRQDDEEKYKQRDVYLKALSLKVESYARLIKDHEKRATQFKKNTAYDTIKQTKQSQKQVSISQSNNNNINNNIFNLNMNHIQSQDELDSEQNQQYNYNDNNDNEQNIKFNNREQQKNRQKYSSLLVSQKDEREWKGRPRKITFGFMDSNDMINKITGRLKGIKMWLDENKIVCGIGFLYQENNINNTNTNSNSNNNTNSNNPKQSQPIGNMTSTELSWHLQANDKINKIQANFTQQGYLAQLIISTYNGLSAKLGLQNAIDKFSCGLEKYQQITGFYCAVRKLGQDTRITELGVWLNKGNTA